MMQNVINVLFGCSHRRTTFPITPGRRNQFAPGAVRHGTYVVCLDCGREFKYDWAEMRQGDAVGARLSAPASASYSPVNR